MYAFHGCSNLTSIIIPRKVTYIGKHAFSPNLTSIKVVPGNHKYDSRNDCNAIILTAINTLIVGCKQTIIPDSVTCIGRDAFSKCTDLVAITIPDSVTCIGGYAFYKCTSLTSVTIPDSVTCIGNYAFLGCTNLTSITIPDSVAHVGKSCFPNFKNPDIPQQP